MKKVQILLVVMLLVVASACSNNEKKVNGPMAQYPSWVMSPKTSDGIAAVGSAKIGPAGMSFARQEAMAQARDELARQMQVKVNNMFKSYTSAVGLAGADGVDKVATNISKQIASETLVGSEQENSWISPEKELFLLVTISSESLKNGAKKAINNKVPTTANERALWQQFKSEQGQAALDAEIEKMNN